MYKFDLQIVRPELLPDVFARFYNFIKSKSGLIRKLYAARQMTQRRELFGCEREPCDRAVSLSLKHKMDGFRTGFSLEYVPGLTIQIRDTQVNRA